MFVFLFRLDVKIGMIFFSYFLFFICVILFVFIYILNDLGIVEMARLFYAHVYSVGTNLMLENDKITEENLRKAIVREKPGGKKKESFYFYLFN
jgi:hypothetical protein